MPHPRISQMHPWLYNLAVETHRVRRDIADFGNRFSSIKAGVDFPHRAYVHESLLRRKLGCSNPQLQENKIINLKLAASHINDIIVKPGETFSLWKLVGRPDADRGYATGMLLKDGEVKAGIGGGLCQMANLFLHRKTSGL